jgi:hypothetical protein
MRIFVIAGIVALSASTSLAQTSTAPAPAAPAPETATPAPPAATAPVYPAATQAGTGQPANLCQELLAFVRENQPEAAAPADAPAAATAPDEPSEEAVGPAGEETADAPAQRADRDAPAADEETAAAGEDSSPASGEAVPPRAPSESGSAQEVTGQSGPAHEAPEPNTEDAAQGNVENAPQTSGLSAPVPTDATEAKEEVPLSLARAEALADANDIAACRDAARKLRLAGAPMSEPLLALTALDLQYQGQANEVQSPAAAPEAPAQQTQP